MSDRPPVPIRGRSVPVVWLGALLTVVVLAVVLRAATLTPPPVTLRTTVLTLRRLAGPAPRPAWPTTGQAALAVAGVGALGSSGGEVPRPIASLTKVMTAYLILKRYPLPAGSPGFTLTVSAADARATALDSAENQSVVAVRAGERLDERQLLEALLIPSGDNVARMLAAYADGSVARFVAEMNATARALGLSHTTYTDPSGYAATTVSVAADQLRIFERALGYAVFRQIVSMPSVTLPVAGTVTNYDPLIAQGYDGKTGSDSAAEGNLAFVKTVTVAGRRLDMVGVVLGQGVGSATTVILAAAGAAAQRLVTSVLPSIGLRTVLPADARVVAARSADGSQVGAVSARALRVIGWGGLPERLTVTRRPVGVALRTHQAVATVTLGAAQATPAGQSASTRVRTRGALAAPGLGWRLGHLL